MINLQSVYILAGLMFCGFAIYNLKDKSNNRRWVNALFWGVYGVTFLFGGELPHFVTGCLAILLAVIAGTGKLGKGKTDTEQPEAVARRESGAKRYGNKLFIPALMIPVVTLIGTLTLKYTPFVEAKNVTLISLVLGTLVAFVVALVMLRDSPLKAIRAGGQTMDTVGWAAILPQMLAALGALFALAGVGGVVADLVKSVIPLGSPLAIIVAYTFGMALFTMIMGNGFAAFPVMTAGIGLPLIVNQLGGNPAIMGAIGMLSGFCGTLMTPMAANFNIVPAALLELQDKNGVIKAQWLTGALLLLVNTALMYLFVFRF
ncbi:membrane protein [Enterobacterales bacterium]|nr:membrane protein [Enterobacterales bacterium]